MKKILSVMLALGLLTTTISACGGATPAASGSAAATASAEAKTAASAANTKQVKLSAMVVTRPNTDKKDLWKDYIPTLIHEKFPNVTVTLDQLPTDQYTSTVKMKLARGQGPDFFTWWARMQAKPLVDSGYVKDMSGMPMMKNFYKDIVDAFSFDGKPYAIPLGMSFLTTWYNKELFKKAGIDAPPTDWPSFLADCEKLKGAGITPIVMGDKQAFVIQFGVYQMGASLIYADNKNFDTELMAGTRKFTDPKWVETLKRYQELYDKGYVIDGSLGLSQDQSRQMFIDGKAAMVFEGSFGYAALTKKGAADFERGMFPLPSNDAGKQMVYNLTPANGLFVNANSKEPEVLQEVLNYWFTQDTPLFKVWVENNDNISSYIGTSDPRPLIQEYLAKYKDLPYIYNLNNAWPSGVSDVLTSKFQNLITKSGTAEDVAQAMQDKLEQLLKK